MWREDGGVTPDSPLWPIQALLVGGVVVIIVCCLLGAYDEWRERQEEAEFELLWSDPEEWLL